MQRAYFFGVTCALVLTLSMTARAQTPAQADAAVVIRSGAIAVTVGELTTVMRNLDPQRREAILRNADTLRGFANDQLIRKLVIAEAKAKKIDEQPEIAQQLEQLRGDVLVTAFLNQSVPVSGIAAPTDAELRQFYSENRANLTGPRQFRLSQIFIVVDPKADAAAQAASKTEIDDIARRLKANNGTNFADVARSRSDDPDSKTKGGDVGLVPETNLQPAIGRVVTRMQVGDISAPIRSASGWHIVRVAEIKPPAQLSFDEVKPALINTLKQQRAETGRQALLNEMYKKSQALISDTALVKVLDGAK